jgi:aryl-alcohol dehydrogenase-like predicted oxidoreductase
MEYRALGRTGVMVSRLGLGTWPLGGSVRLAGAPTGYGEVPESEAVRAVRRAVELGISFFDTADSYGLGRAERILGKALADRRGQVVLATKAGWVPDGVEKWLGDVSADHLRAAAERSRRRLAVDVLDVFQLHRVPEPGDATEAALDALDELKTRGVVRLVGASVGYDVEGGRRLLRTGRIDVLQVHYNLLHQGAAPLLEEARVAGVGVLASTPLAHGFLAGGYTLGTRFAADDWRSELTDAEIATRVERVGEMRFLAGDGTRTMLAGALGFVLAHPGVSSAIPGFRSVEQVDGLADAVAAEPLSDIEVARAKEAGRARARAAADV